MSKYWVFVYSMDWTRHMDTVEMFVFCFPVDRIIGFMDDDYLV